MYFKYNWSCICILHFCKSEILFQNTFQVMLRSILRKKYYQIEFFYSSYKCNTRYIWKSKGSLLNYTVLHCKTSDMRGRNYFYWMQTSNNCHSYCCWHWTVTVHMNNYCGHWTVVLTFNMNDYCFYSVMHKIYTHWHHWQKLLYWMPTIAVAVTLK